MGRSEVVTCALAAFGVAELPRKKKKHNSGQKVPAGAGR